MMGLIMYSTNCCRRPSSSCITASQSLLITFVLRSELGLFRGEAAAELGRIMDPELTDTLFSVTLLEPMDIVCGGVRKSVDMGACLRCLSTVVGVAAFWVGARLAQGCGTTGRSMDEDTCGLKGLKDVVTDSPGVLVSWDIAELISDMGVNTRGENSPSETGSLFVEGWFSSGCVTLLSSTLDFEVNETDWLVS